MSLELRRIARKSVKQYLRQLDDFKDHLQQLRPQQTALDADIFAIGPASPTLQPLQDASHPSQLDGTSTDTYNSHGDTGMNSEPDRKHLLDTQEPASAESSDSPSASSSHTASSPISTAPSQDTTSPDGVSLPKRRRSAHLPGLCAASTAPDASAGDTHTTPTELESPQEPPAAFMTTDKITPDPIPTGADGSIILSSADVFKLLEAASVQMTDRNGPTRPFALKKCLSESDLAGGASDPLSAQYEAQDSTLFEDDGLEDALDDSEDPTSQGHSKGEFFLCNRAGVRFSQAMFIFLESEKPASFSPQSPRCSYQSKDQEDDTPHTVEAKNEKKTGFNDSSNGANGLKTEDSESLKVDPMLAVSKVSEAPRRPGSHKDDTKEPVVAVREIDDDQMETDQLVVDVACDLLDDAQYPSMESTTIETRNIEMSDDDDDDDEPQSFDDAPALLDTPDLKTTPSPTADTTAPGPFFAVSRPAIDDDIFEEPSADPDSETIERFRHMLEINPDFCFPEETPETHLAVLQQRRTEAKIALRGLEDNFVRVKRSMSSRRSVYRRYQSLKARERDVAERVEREKMYSQMYGPTQGLLWGGQALDSGQEEERGRSASRDDEEDKTYRELNIARAARLTAMGGSSPLQHEVVISNTG